jgi:hypothetical protein
MELQRERDGREFEISKMRLEIEQERAKADQEKAKLETLKLQLLLAQIQQVQNRNFYRSDLGS